MYTVAAFYAFTTPLRSSKRSISGLQTFEYKFSKLQLLFSKLLIVRVQYVHTKRRDYVHVSKTLLRTVSKRREMKTDRLAATTLAIFNFLYFSIFYYFLINFLVRHYLRSFCESV
jgi:hypothetical protein